MLTDKIKAAAAQLGISDLAEKLYASVIAIKGVDDVVLDFANWEPDCPSCAVFPKSCSIISRCAAPCRAPFIIGIRTDLVILDFENDVMPNAKHMI